MSQDVDDMACCQGHMSTELGGIGPRRGGQVIRGRHIIDEKWESNWGKKHGVANRNMVVANRNITHEVDN